MSLEKVKTFLKDDDESLSKKLLRKSTLVVSKLSHIHPHMPHIPKAWKKHHEAHPSDEDDVNEIKASATMKKQIKGMPTDVLGGGGFGRVFKVILNNGFIVATKVQQATAEETKHQFKARVDREFECQKRGALNKHIIKVFSLVEGRKSFYMVMELADGGSLADRQASNPGPLVLNEALCNMRKLADAVSFLHKQGVVHRDIKSLNILFNQEGILKIADFGSSGIISNPLHMITRVGLTPEFAAPENNSNTFKQLRHLEFIDRQDVYSCGIVFLSMLVGISGMDEWNTDPLKCIQHVPAKLQSPLEHMLHPSRALRWSIDQVIKEGWFSKVALCGDGSITHVHCDRQINESTLDTRNVKLNEEDLANLCEYFDEI